MVIDEETIRFEDVEVEEKFYSGIRRLARIWDTWIEILSDQFIPRGTAYLVMPAACKVIVNSDDAKMSVEDIGKLQIVQIYLGDQNV